MATKKIVQGKEMYAGKAAMMKHEKKEPMKKEMKEEKQEKMMGMAKGGGVMKKSSKSPALAIVIGMSKPKAAGSKMMMNKGGMAKGKK